MKAGQMEKQEIIEHKQRVLQERARLLAKAPQEAVREDDSIEVLGFMLGQEYYALETAYIEEVYPLQELTPLPCTPNYILGIVHLRGRIISVIDVKKFFDLPEKGITDLNKVILLRQGAMEFGILADMITSVMRLPTNTLQAALPTLTGIRADYLKGITPARHIVLDAVKLLTDTTIIVNEEVMS